MTRKKPELPEGDDGRTIADMNVEGMPWYSPQRSHSAAAGERKTVRETAMTRDESRY